MGPCDSGRATIMASIAMMYLQVQWGMMKAQKVVLMILGELWALAKIVGVGLWTAVTWPARALYRYLLLPIGLLLFAVGGCFYRLKECLCGGVDACCRPSYEASGEFGAGAS